MMSDGLFFFALGVLVVAGLVYLRRRYAEFSGQTAPDYVDDFPQFVMREHLNGFMICDGVIFGPLGRVTSTFNAEFDISWHDNICTMKEEFRYNDGSVQNREWRIVMEGVDHFEATADDVPGIAKGEVAGSAVLFRYPIELPEGSGGHTLSAFDCMYLTENGTIVNRSQFRKFGFRVAELVATIHKKEAV